MSQFLFTKSSAPKAPLMYAKELLKAGLSAPMSFRNSALGGVSVVELGYQVSMKEQFASLYLSEALRLACKENCVEVLDFLMQKKATLSHLPGGAALEEGSAACVSAQDVHLEGGLKESGVRWGASLWDQVRQWGKADAGIPGIYQGGFLNMCLLNGSFDCLEYLEKNHPQIIEKEVGALSAYPLGSNYLEKYFKGLKEYMNGKEFFVELLGLENEGVLKGKSVNGYLVGLRKSEREKVFRRLFKRNRMGLMHEVMQAPLALHPLLSVFRIQEEKAAVKVVQTCERLGLFENMSSLLSHLVIKSVLASPEGSLKSAFLHCFAKHKVSTPIWVDGALESIVKMSCQGMGKQEQIARIQEERRAFVGSTIPWEDLLRGDGKSAVERETKLVGQLLHWLDTSGQLVRWDGEGRASLKQRMMQMLLQPLEVHTKKQELCAPEYFGVSGDFAKICLHDKEKWLPALCLGEEELRRLEQGIIKMLASVSNSGVQKSTAPKQSAYYLEVCEGLKVAQQCVTGVPTHMAPRALRL